MRPETCARRRLALSVQGSRAGTLTVCPGPVKTEFADVAGIGGAEDRTPDFVWTAPEQVARAAIEGAEKNKRVVVPGALNRATSLMGQHSPRAVALPLTRQIWRRGAL